MDTQPQEELRFWSCVGIVLARCSGVKKIDNPKEREICKFDGVNTSTVYIGSFDDLQKVYIDWQKEYISALGMEVETLTLEEIKEQINTDGYEFLITVFIDSPLCGEILQHGNYGDSWYQIGETSGYA